MAGCWSGPPPEGVPTRVTLFGAWRTGGGHGGFLPGETGLTSPIGVLGWALCDFDRAPSRPGPVLAIEANGGEELLGLDVKQWLGGYHIPSESDLLRPVQNTMFQPAVGSGVGRWWLKRRVHNPAIFLFLFNIILRSPESILPPD